MEITYYVSFRCDTLFELIDEKAIKSTFKLRLDRTLETSENISSETFENSKHIWEM